MFKKLFARKVVLFRRAIPIATIALAVTAVAALAWVSIFLVSTRFAVSTTPALIAPAPVGEWVCWQLAGTGATIDVCAEQPGGNGPQVVISGLSEDNLSMYAWRIFHNSNAVPMTLTLVGTQHPELPVALSTDGATPVGSITVAPGASPEIYILVHSSGIGPGESLDVTGLEMRWAP